MIYSKYTVFECPLKTNNLINRFFWNIRKFYSHYCIFDDGNLIKDLLYEYIFCNDKRLKEDFKEYCYNVFDYEWYDVYDDIISFCEEYSEKLNVIYREMKKK